MMCRGQITSDLIKQFYGKEAKYVPVSLIEIEQQVDEE